MSALATVCLRQWIHTVHTLQVRMIYIVIINQYLNDLGTEAQALDRSTLANMCRIVLDGGGAGQPSKPSNGKEFRYALLGTFQTI